MRLGLFVILFTFFLIAQDRSDTISLSTISMPEFLKFVDSNHPLTSRAQLQIYKAESKLLKAKGNFDPQLNLDYYNKDFKGKNYFDNAVSSLQVPIWYGPNLIASYQRANGVFLNPNQTVPNEGLFSLGIELPIGRGLFYDSRRFEQNSAEITNEISQFERQKLINELYYRSRQNFIDWYSAITNQGIFLRNLNNSEQRLNLVRIGYRAGDYPAIDTLEAFAQFRNRFVEFKKGVAKFSNVLAKTAGLISFGNNFERLLTLTPEVETDIDTTRLKEIIGNINSINPELQSISADRKIAELSEDLARENLKPSFNINYNFINNGDEFYSLDRYQVANNNWNFNFQFPLFLRKQRGDLQLADIKIKETKLRLQDKTVGIIYRLDGIYNQIVGIIPLIDEYLRVQDNYQKLLDSEFLKYNLGDSSLFKVNNRENKLIEVQLKVIQLITDLKKLEAEFYYEAGIAN